MATQIAFGVMRRVNSSIMSAVLLHASVELFSSELGVVKAKRPYVDTCLYVC